ncbi:MAG TPA: class I SAM-dependent methyltransferase [Burkholderiales bacterium]|nr:class I SAM-dependent methyltransferase [Burkholderiales bacterium]
MGPAEYDAWYETPRGRWIGETEYRLIRQHLSPRPGDSLLDVGCGTGYFTRRFARELPGAVAGVDPNAEWLEYARSKTGAIASYVQGAAEALPFADRSFDLVISVTALCFVQDEARSLSEILRVARRRFALGLLNRRSLLWRDKGRGGGTGAYRGARWHTCAEIRNTLRGLTNAMVTCRTAIQLPGGGPISRAAEMLSAVRSPWGGFLLVAGDVGP